MEWLVWLGALVSILGIIAMVWCIIHVFRMRRANLDDAEMRARMKTPVLVNFAALAVSTLGLMMVIAGIFLS